MNLTSPVLKGAVHAAELPGNSVTSFVKRVADAAGFLPTTARTAGSAC